MSVLVGETIQGTVQQAAVALRDNRFEEAINQLQGALSQAPNDFTTNHMLGVALGKAGRRPEAIARLLKATQLNPDHAAARTHLGLAYAGADKHELARQNLEAALRVAPDFAPAQNALSRLPAPPPKVLPKAASTVAKTVTPAAPVPPKAVAKDNAKPAKVKSKPAKPKAEIDWASITLLGLGALLVVGGLYLNFVMYEGIRPYRLFGRIAIMIGVGMFAAGLPSHKDDWKSDM